MENDSPRNEKPLGIRNYSVLPQRLLDTAKETLLQLKTAARRVPVAAALAISLAACGHPSSSESANPPSHPSASPENPTISPHIPGRGIQYALSEFTQLKGLPQNAQLLEISDHGRDLTIVNLGPSPVNQGAIATITKGLISFPFSNEPLYLSYEDGTGEHVSPTIIRRPAAQIVIIGAPGQRFANTPPNSTAHTGFHLIDGHLIAISAVERTGDPYFDTRALITEVCNGMVFAAYGEQRPYSHHLGLNRFSTEIRRIILLQEGICNEAAHALAARAGGFLYGQYSATQSGYYSFPKIGGVSSRLLNEENYNALPSIPPVYAK
jgi:hypothetical protein